MFDFLNLQGNNKTTYLFALAIIILGIIFRFYNLNYENLWFDETFSSIIKPDPSALVCLF